MMALFSFALPNKTFNQAEAVPKTNHLAMEHIPRSDKLESEKATILIANDELINLQVMQNQLTLNGYHVITVTTGEEVFQQIKESKIDLLILDLMMPEMSGYEVCRQIRENFTIMELPILMVTTRNQAQNISTPFNVGANDFLTKPYDNLELFHRMESLLHLVRLNKENLRIKELQDMNIELNKINTDLVQLLDSRNQLLANIAHELGEPLTLIHSYAQSVQEGLIHAKPGRYLEMVFNKISVIDCLIYDLSNVSKLESSQFSLNKKRIQFEQWIKQVLSKLEFEVNQSGRRFISPNISQIPKFDEYFIMVDVDRMDQVFSNLIQNAIKYTPLNTGEISLTIKIDESEKEVIIEVHDNGVGIDHERLPHVFERYHTGTDSGSLEETEGSGLGLAIVKDIIKLHKARVWAVSQVNQGSSFSIALPVHCK